MATLRQECKQRLKVAFDSVRAASNMLNFILVVDNYGLKVLSNTIKTMELINYGITVVQRLELIRKKIKMEAVYLIHPKSISTVLEDFPQDGEPQYKSIHILTLSKISMGQMEQMAQNVTFARRVKTLREINFNYSLHSQNEVKICNYDERSFQKTRQKNNSLLQSTIDQLSTILTSMSAFYIVQIYYQKNGTSNFTEKVAQGLKEKFQNLFKYYEKGGISNYNSSAPITTFLILDRSFDAVSPLVRDFHYLPLLYDFKNIKNHKITDFGKQKKTLTLNQNDQILQKYKNAHISAALKGIPHDFQQFSKSHAAAKFQKGQTEMDMKDLGQVLKKMPQYVDVKDRYSLHYQALQGLLEAMQSKRYKQQGYLEQSLLSLTNQQGKKVKQKDIFASLVTTLEKTSSSEQKAKLVLIGLMCLELKPKQQGILVQFINKTPYKGIQKNLNLLSGPNIYRLNPKKQNKGNQILDKHLPKIEELFKSMSNQDYGDLKHLRVGAADKSSKPTQKNQSNLGLKKIRFDNEKKDRPKMIVFVNSAIGYNQMRALSQFQNTYQMIYASHNFVTPSQYVRLINDMGKLEEEEQEQL